MSEQDIVNILEAYETTTYPGGVGSTFRCIKTSSYWDIAKQINELNK